MERIQPGTQPNRGIGKRVRDGNKEREGECYRAEKTDKNRDLHKLTTSDMKEEERE